MRKIILLIAAFVWLTNVEAQTKHHIDSLNKVVATTKQDTEKVMTLLRLSILNKNNPVSKFSIANKALVLARKIKFEKGEADCYYALGDYFINISDYPQSLEYNLKALKLSEKLDYSPGIVRSLGAVGHVYSTLQNDEAALAYYFKQSEVLTQNIIPLQSSSWALLYTRISRIYLRQNKLDSALIYSMRSNEKATKAKTNLGLVLTDLANVYTAMGNSELAFLYYRMSMAQAKQNNNMAALGSCYLALAKLFIKTSTKDSAIYYAKQALTLSGSRQNKEGLMNSAKLLAQLYENKDNTDAKYYKMAMEAQESISSGAQIAQIQSLSFTEQERQREVNESKLKEAEERKHNLQFAAIAIGLITFIILFFALSRSIIVKTKFIEFFGVLLLLAVFEFINLFIHPYLAHATDDSPVLMLLILIIIGAMLVPLHHKLEKWITKIMVEKNKKIRLEAARKTIENLEPTVAEASTGRTEQTI
ncbi:tetratricopeptide repeat protein [Daejeonella sp.]|uniref:tetratricopeptide repeat protein n=1 Tax=Daejeonella sp. TaxID=2805397 RepID=UPI00273177A2|nr:hypothetical protein [Daejeonella sp.]MDP2414984.1 hypothetical protein [Daejeonella sp.]